ncbi:probable aminopeptidase NPEPL1 [Aplysia californica]|uniref:Probable aminopeptidase NPEPL1 n=1 Tax=Aplysia californica TaxID=6500 RepID=A0ABM0JWZ2_APLCA|nr:probable aminopeptidase NPEPL1 [Aplysia californica]
MAALEFSASLKPADPYDNAVLIIGQLKHLGKLRYEDVQCKFGGRVDAETFSICINSLHPSPTDQCSLWLNSATVAALPLKCSRHNTPSRCHALTRLVKSCLAGGQEYIVIVCERENVYASGLAVARALPLFTAKSGSHSLSRKVTVEFLVLDEERRIFLTDEELECMSVAATSLRLAASIVDTPCSDMSVDNFLQEIREVGKELGITPKIISGEDLIHQGFGGIYGVGKAAAVPPALAVLSHIVPDSTESIAWVGKGIVFDTGGLSIKTKTGMCGMKRDCGGAAAVLGAFKTAVKMGFSETLHAVFCLADNAVGPLSQRPDDIVHMYSGRTVEINNTDAEGRLVLADGVAYAVKDLRCDIIVDIATLTGAQGVATGKYHAGIVCNDEKLEETCVKVGQACGDLVHPMPFTPELHSSEFSSAVADMKNSVADRSNAQVSCAGLFIMSHLGPDFQGIWLHIDMAIPAATGERATGYGVALLTSLFGNRSGNPLLRLVGPKGPVNNGTAMEQDSNEGTKRIKLV